MLDRLIAKSIMLTRKETPLIRQIHEKILKDGNFLGFEIFAPRPKDKKLVSVDNGDRISGILAFIYFHCTPFPTIGYAKIHVADCMELNLPVTESPSINNPNHALIDMRSLVTDKQIKEAAKRLYLAALDNDEIHLFSGTPNLPPGPGYTIFNLENYNPNQGD